MKFFCRLNSLFAARVTCAVVTCLHGIITYRAAEMFHTTIRILFALLILYFNSLASVSDWSSNGQIVVSSAFSSFVRHCFRFVVQYTAWSKKVGSAQVLLSSSHLF